MKKKFYLSGYLLLLLFVSVSTFVTAQPTTINTTIGSVGYVGTNNDGNNSFITFTLQNNSGQDIEIIEVGRWSDAGYNGSTNTLWYSTTSLSGPVTAPLSGPTWTSVASGVPTGLPATLQVNPVISGMSFTVPNGVTWRFALHTTATNHYSGGTSSPAPNNFTASGVTLATGDFQIAGQNVGYGGVNTPRFFTGFVTFKPKAIPCSGVPSNAVVLGPDEICPKVNFSLNVGLSSGLLLTGLTYKWQFSDDGTAWKNWTGPVSSNGAITDAITKDKWYRCDVTCIASGQSFVTPPKKVAIAPFYYCYCTGSVATAAAGMDIGNVTMVSFPNNDLLLNNGTASPFLSNPASNKSYSDFRYSIPPIPMYHDSSYRLLVSQINSNTTFAAGTAAVYIDFNRNGTFDVAERVLLGTTTQIPSSPGLLTDTITVPNTAEFGITGMRVILNAGVTPPDTCASYTDGETEDYLVDLRYLPCDKVTTAGIVEGDTSVCTGYDYLLTDTSYQTKRYGLTKLWQRSADGIGWSDIAGSAPKDTLMRLFTGQPLFYRVREICTVTNDTAYSDAHKVNLKAAYKCYCFSQAVGGPSFDSSDMGGFSIYGFAVNDGGTHLGNPRAVRKRQDFTDLQPIELLVDSIYEFHVFHTMPRDQHADAKITMFIDFNNNHKYDIPQEKVYTGFTNSGYHTVISNVLVLDSAIVNTPTGLRVILNNDVAPNVPSDEACGTYTSGETEDYMVVFKRPFLTGVQDLKSSVDHMQLYPNPTSNGRFTVRFHYAANSHVNVRITTLTGQQVMNRGFDHRGGWFTQELDISGQPGGVYFVELDANGVKTTKKLVIQ